MSGARLFLDEQNLRQLGFTEPNVRTLRSLTEFLNVQNTVSTVVGPIEDLTTTGILTRVGDNQWATRTLGATAGHITVTNGDGVADNPSLALPSSGVTAGSYTIASVTFDAQGRATAASNGTASGVLDAISSTRGAVLYRGASGWSALAPGTSGQFLKTLGAGADPAWATASGGGSYRYEKFGALPLASTFTGVSSANLSLVDGNNNMRAVWTASGANNVQIQKKAAPSTPYDVCMRLRPSITGTNVQVGIVLRNSSSGKFLLLAIQSVNTITAQEWTSVSSFSSSVASQATPHIFNGTAPGWLRVNNDGTTLTFYYSADGDYWISFGTRTLSSFLSSCDEYGIGAVCQSASQAFIGSFGAALPT
jgi:hypothetical protein